MLLACEDRATGCTPLSEDSSGFYFIPRYSTRICNKIKSDGKLTPNVVGVLRGTFHEKTNFRRVSYEYPSACVANISEWKEITFVDEKRTNGKDSASGGSKVESRGRLENAVF